MGDSYVEGGDLVMQRIGRQMRKPAWITTALHREAADEMDRIIREMEDIQEEKEFEVRMALAKKYNITEDQARIAMEEDW